MVGSSVVVEAVTFFGTVVAGGCDVGFVVVDDGGGGGIVLDVVAVLADTTALRSEDARLAR